MDYSAIIRRSWDLVKHNRSLWWLGVLAALTEGASSYSGNFPSDPNRFERQSEMSRVFGESIHQSTFATSNITSGEVAAIIVFVAIFILIMLGIIYISLSAKAGLILSINELEERKKGFGFRLAYHKGKSFVWRIIGSSLILCLYIVAALVVGIAVVGPFAFAYSQSHNPGILAIAILLGTIGLILLVVFSFAIGIVGQLSARLIVLKNKKIVASLHEAWKLTKKHVGELFLALVISSVLRFAFMIALLIAMIVLFVIGLLVIIPLSIIAVPFSALLFLPAGLVFIAALFIASGIYSAFSSSYWTLVFRAIYYLEHK